MSAAETHLAQAVSCHVLSHDLLAHDIGRAEYQGHITLETANSRQLCNNM
jgi:hypothetical protein